MYAILLNSEMFFVSTYSPTFTILDPLVVENKRVIYFFTKISRFVFAPPHIFNAKFNDRTLLLKSAESLIY